MPLTRLIVFDDGGGVPGPLTDMRAAFEVRTGVLTTLERIAGAFPGLRLAGVFVPGHLAAVVRERMGVPVNDAGALGGEGALLVSGRSVLPPAGATALTPGSAIVGAGGAVLAANLEGGAARAVVERGALPAGCRVERRADAPVLERAWDVVRHRNAAIEHDMRLLLGRLPIAPLPAQAQAVNAGAIRIGPGVRVYPGVVLDAEGGPIVLDHEAVVRPNAVVSGPAFVGARSVVLDGAVIRGNTVIGPGCKVNGEVSGTIFQGFSNKSHDGFVGDSFVGEWVNLGAGTITSNLLNTYGEVAAHCRPEAARERTGMTFLGSIIGDHVKTAIGTRLMTGSVIGTGAMLATSGPPPACVGNFAWLSEGRTQIYRLSKFLEVCAMVMARRGAEPSEAVRSRLRALHEAETSQLVAPPYGYDI